ncbi:methionine adenosyltransferase [Niallia circulans]|nr:methionine adenosyltransferase [Niallia circulans]
MCVCQFKYITSEAVTEGHPDKVCDQISDAILDAYLTMDKNARVAVECMLSKQLLVIAGEVHSNVKIDIERIARKKILDIGYDQLDKGLDGNTCLIIQNIIQQSEDIAAGVEIALESRSASSGEKAQLGAGDQGMMYGYACSESEAWMPLPIYLANQLAERLSFVRKSGLIDYLLPDGKTQVTVAYDSNNIPIQLTDIVISSQHKDGISQEQIREDIIRHVITEIIPTAFVSKDTRILINPSGRFVIGGPAGDTGLTGRKIIADTYGGFIPHGGGAFSGKDPTKVDRSAAYMARYVAKNLVAAQLAERCQIAVSYAIGVAKPISIYIETFGTEKISLEILTAITEAIFDFSPSGIIDKLQLKQPIYSETSAYGHFKNNDMLPWEKIDMVPVLKAVVEQISKR